MPAQLNLSEPRTQAEAMSGADLGGASGATAVSTPNDADLDVLCKSLAHLAAKYRTPADWPKESLDLCAEAGVYRWFLPESSGGFGWNDADQVRGYLRLAAADLTTTFVITQFMGACKRLASSENKLPASRYLNALLSGQMFATVGISHLTTSSQHLGKPALRATKTDLGFVLDGMSPWVTGAVAADVLVLAATLEDGRELLAAVPTISDGVVCGPGNDLVALSSSCTDRVSLKNTFVPHEMVLAGPMHGVMKSGAGAGTGGLQTSTLAAGLATAAVEFVAQEAIKREELKPIAEQLRQQSDELCNDLISAASGGTCDASELRGRANRFVMRTTQAAMSAAKGAGFVAGHPVGRWCKEALFFLVWSCPQPVTQEHLCELAGIDN